MSRRGFSSREEHAAVSSITEKSNPMVKPRSIRNNRNESAPHPLLLPGNHSSKPCLSYHFDCVSYMCRYSPFWPSSSSWVPCSMILPFFMT